MLLATLACTRTGGDTGATPPADESAATARQAVWDKSYGGTDKSYDSELLRLRALIAPRFQSLTFEDQETGRTMDYNLYVPKDYDPDKRYPLVLFMADASTTGKRPDAPLMQGYGGIIWATNESQAEHPCFVLVPAFAGPENAVNDNWETSEEVGMALRLLESVVSRFSIDRDRLYTTGQSMGGMISFYLNANHPDLFAASIFVGSQWDINVLAPLAKQKFFYIVSAGDEKASGGMQELGDMLQSKEVAFGSAEFSAKLPAAEQENRIQHLLNKERRINFVRFTPGTVTPAGPQGPGGEHMYSFDYAYKLKAVRDWLFRQTKAPSVRDMYEKGMSTSNETLAFSYFMQAAKLGYGPALHQVAKAYASGSGVAQDSAQAIAWYEKAIAQGTDRSMLDLALMYFNGTGVTQDYAKAARLFRLACLHGNMKAPRYLGIMQEEGRGCAVDFGKALRYYLVASDAGDITAAARIGSLYERGLGVAQSYEQALHWYRIAAPSPEEAARKVHPRILALMRLGYFHEMGLGVKKDVAQALVWYRVAARDNAPEAEAAIRRLAP